MRGAQAAGFANKLKRTPHRTSVSLQERLTFLELILAYAAQGADKIVGQIFPLRAGGDAVVRIAGGFVVHPATDGASVNFHICFLSGPPALRIPVYRYPLHSFLKRCAEKIFKVLDIWRKLR